MNRKIYKLTCQGCEETRETSQSYYSQVMRGIKSTYCFKCSYSKSRCKDYKVRCPFCFEERSVSQSIYSQFNTGKAKGLCETCALNYVKFGDKQEIVTPQVLANEIGVKIHKEKKAMYAAIYKSRHRDILNEKSREYRRNNIDHKRFIGRVAQFKRRAFSHISKNIIEQIIEEHTINGMIFCYICRTECSDNYHIDHVIPIIKGGRNNKENLKIACSFCNQSKGAKDLDEFLDRNPYLKALHLKEEA